MGGIFGGKNPLKSAEKAVKKGVKDLTDQGILSVGSGWAEKGLANKLYGQKGRRRVSRLQKYAPGKGFDVQFGKDLESVDAYFNPEVPELSPDPQIAAEAKAEAARRRNRNFGRSMLMTSRKRTQTLGV